MSANTTRRRVARKARECPSCDRIIPTGATYLEHTEFPGGPAGYATTAGHPIRVAECSSCATRYGRADALAVTA